MNLLLPLLDELKDKTLPTPEEFDYWKNRENRTFYIDYEIGDDYSLIELGKTIIQMNMSEMSIPKEELKPIILFIHSYGGDVEQALFFSDLCMCSRIPIITVSMGAAMSSGFLIMLSGHKRYAFKHSQLLVHSGGAGFQGTAEQMEAFQKNYKKQLNEMKSYVLERTSIDEKIFNKNKTKDWYLTAEELIKYNVVDKLITNFEEIME